MGCSTHGAAWRLPPLDPVERLGHLHAGLLARLFQALPQPLAQLGRRVAAYLALVTAERLHLLAKELAYVNMVVGPVRPGKERLSRSVRLQPLIHLLRVVQVGTR